jgi:hypothetical protein
MLCPDAPETETIKNHIDFVKQHLPTNKTNLF